LKPAFESVSTAGQVAKSARYFWDSEFDETAPDGFSVAFISGALVAESGEEFYGVYENIQPETLTRPWLQEHVIARLPPRSEWKSLEDIRQGILAVIKPAKEIEIWCKSTSTDAFILGRIFGGSARFREILKAEKGIGHVSFRDTNELRRWLHWPQLPKQPDKEHHVALYDARHEKSEFLLMRDMIAHSHSPPAYRHRAPQSERV
jgi:hypothetical protein